MPAEEIEDAVRVYERPSSGGAWEEIDDRETGFFVDKAEDLRLEVVFVLDYTSSMTRYRLSDGASGAVTTIRALESAARALPGAPRIGVVEFHDRNIEPAVLSPLTADIGTVLATVREFERSGFERGSSRLWDGVVTGLDLFSHDPNTVRALVFVSDGHDTSSVETLEKAVDYAIDRNVHLYAAGVGVADREERLRRGVASTGGAYFPVRVLGGLDDLVGTIASNLRGYYKISYVTLRRTGQHKMGLRVALGGTIAWLETDSFDAARFFGPDNHGLVEFDAPSLDRFSGQATLFMRARHVPRNINRIRFKLNTTRPISIEPVAAADDGLLSGWALSGPDHAGWYEASSSRPLPFGSSGLLFKVTLFNIDDPSSWLTVDFDNSIYPGSKEFSGQIRVRVGSLPRIVFASFRDGNYEIYAMNADGSDQVRLTDDPGNDNRPNWSPDGRHIVFHSNRAGYWQIYVMNADGSDQKPLTSGTHPSWSPDGRRVAFVSKELYVINADGSGRTRLTHDSVANYDPDWSPDGRRIAFHSLDDGVRAVHIVDADGSGRRSIADARDANWSGDGRRIVFDSNRAGYWQIYVMNADGSDQRLLRPGIHPNWSNGGRIAFSWNDDIYVMNDDGSGLTRLTETPGTDFAPSW